MTTPQPPDSYGDFSVGEHSAPQPLGLNWKATIVASIRPTTQHTASTAEAVKAAKRRF
jgi:hypothetical protein